MIAIIDYGSGNLSSVKNALDYIGAESLITSDPSVIKKAERVIFPGVGSFGYMMKSLDEKGLIEPIKEAIESGKPFLGICLGMHALFESSEESDGVRGLGIFRGNVVKFRKGKIPQIGWNMIVPEKRGVFREGFVYFVNSYYVVPEDESVISTKTDYYGEFVSGIEKGNVTASQFHPEKSGEFGLGILRRWVRC